MTEIPITARIPQELEKELENYMTIEHLEKSVAVRRLLYKSLQEWREKHALKLLEEGKVSLLKAAKIAGMDIWSFMEKIKEAKIKWVSEEGIDKDLEEFRK